MTAAQCKSCGASEPSCEVCHGYGAPTPDLVVTVPVDLVPAMEAAMLAEDERYAHPVYEARTISASFTASLKPDVRSFKQERHAVKQAVADITATEDAVLEGMIRPKVVVREVDHSSVYRAVDGVVLETGMGVLLTNQAGPKRNGIYTVSDPDVAAAKWAEAKRYAPSRSRVGNAVPPSKSKVMNRSKAKAAKKARKAGRRV